MNESADHVEIIREAFRYTQAFRDKTFVLQVEDSIVDEAILPSLVRDLVLLHRTGIHIVVVAGARGRIDEVLGRYNVESSLHNGIRISNPEAIPFIKMAAFDVANRIMTSLSAFGVNSVIGNWVRARSLGVVDGIDFKDSGTVDRIRADLLGGVIEQGAIPILTCIGWSLAGKPYNLSSRTLATTLAVSLQASKLFFVSASDSLNSGAYTVDDGIHTAPDGRISRLSLDEAKRLLELNPPPSPGSAPMGVELVGHAVRAAEGGVERVHLVDGRSDGAVLREIFSNLGVGTMLYTNKYHNIRAMRRDDVADVHRLMRPLVDRGLLVPRSEIDLDDLHPDFVVFETDDMVHGCGALHRFEGDGATHAEIAGLAVDPHYDHLGIGRRIVTYLIDRAREEGIERVFALTTQASDWFEQLGFRPGSISDVPGEKRSAYDHARNSRVVVFDVQ